MRDKIKDTEYFNCFIKEDLTRVNKFTSKLKSGEVKAERVLPVKSKIHDLRLGILIARYSKGDELALLEQEYLSLVEEWEEIYEPDYYNKNLQMISLAVLFELDTTFVKRIKRMVEKSGINDWLFAFLLNWLDDEKTENDKALLFPDTFSTLRKAVFEENKAELLKKYLSNDWYNEDCGCYEAHKSKQNIYYGYWSFEAGAMAKILNIDDDILRNQPYYPYDLVHYKR